MTIAILELNDQALLIQTEEGRSHIEPGFARVTPSGIESGDKAWAMAWQNPQDCFNQYWRQLNQLPLPRKQNWARHHGDIAYAQIKHMLESVGSPSNIILAVPGCFNEEQLALLLGLAQAIPVQVDAVIDSALAMSLYAQKETLLLDIQLQQSVVSLISEINGNLVVSEQSIIPDLGILYLYNGVARHISDRLIDDYRYDPLHTSEGEQTIYDQLPAWLKQLGWQNELSINLPSPRGDLPMRLHRKQVAIIIEQRLESLNNILEKHPNAQITFSHSASLLQAILPRFAGALVMSQTSGVDNCLTARREIIASSETLHKIISLEKAGGKSNNLKPKPRCANHLLYQNQAWPLDKPLSINLQDGELILTNSIDKNAALVVVIKDQSLQIIHQSDTIDTQIPRTCEPGQRFVLAGHKLSFIEVSNA
jgi:hypothetical protein